MNCTNCGTPIEEGMAFCAACGAVTTTTPTPGSPVLSEEEYYDTYADKKLKSNYKATMIICFITAAISVGFIAMGNFYAAIDLILFLTLGILMIKKRTWTLPLIVAVVGGIGSVISMATTGTPSGILALIFAISATIGMKKFHAEYKQYVENNSTPIPPANQ